MGAASAIYGCKPAESLGTRGTLNQPAHGQEQLQVLHNNVLWAKTPRIGVKGKNLQGSRSFGGEGQGFLQIFCQTNSLNDESNESRCRSDCPERAANPPASLFLPPKPSLHQL